jgi:DNA repair protein RadC
MRYCIRTVTWRFKESIELDLPAKRSITIRSPKDVFENYQSLFKDQVRERFVVFWLNSANKVIGFEVITEGLLNSSLCHPREIYRGACVATAASIIIAHNHPSGNPEPSQEDIVITKQVVDSGKILGIPVHDHIIFAEDTYTSFTERGLM